MKGTMMQTQLALVSLLERAGKLFPKTKVVSQRPTTSESRSAPTKILSALGAGCLAPVSPFRVGLRRINSEGELWH
jgi:hypothetical protein